MLWTAEDSDWAKAVLRLKPGKGADPGGWTHEAWQYLWEEVSLQAPLVTWLRSLCTAPADTQRAACIHRYRAVCLAKLGGGVRPVVISSLMRKLMCSAFVPAVRRDLGAHFEHVQYGAATSDGCLQMYAHLSTLLQRSPSQRLYQTDISNAFCTLGRQAAYDALCRLVGDAPWLSFLHYLLEQDMHVNIPEWADQPASTLRSACGIGQGDPLSSLLFAAVITEAIQSFCRLEHIKDLGIDIVAYIDDCVMAGEPAAVAQGAVLCRTPTAIWTCYGWRQVQGLCSRSDLATSTSSA